MLETERMTKLLVVGPKTKLQEAIEKLHELKAAHIIEHKKSEELDIGAPLGHSDKLSELLITTRSLISHFKIENEGKKASKLPLKELEKKLSTLETDYQTTYETIREKTEEKKVKEEELTLSQTLRSLGITKHLPSSEFVSVHIGTVQNVEELKVALSHKTEAFEISHVKKDDCDVVAVFAHKHQEREIESALNVFNFSPLETDILDTLKGTLDDHIKKLTKEIADCTSTLEKLKKHLSTLKDSNKSFLCETETKLTIETDKAQIPLSFGSSDNAFFLETWVPTKHKETFKKELETVTKGKLYLEEKEIKKNEEPPIKMDNPAGVKNFEFFMNLYTLPTYREFDPTLFIFLTFPLFFGIMLGDVIYGFIIMTLFYFLYRKIESPEFKGLLKGMMVAAVFTIIFGVVYGEYLGYEHIPEGVGEKMVGLGFPLIKTFDHGHVYYDIPRLLQRTHAEIAGIPIVLIIGAIIGVIHINIGFLIGFVGVYQRHGLMHAIEEKLSWIILELGIVGLVWSIIKSSTAGVWISVLVMIGAVWLLYKGEGAQGLVELPTIFTNSLSYMRLGAVGLASVYLAFVVNEYFAGPFIHKGGWFILIGILIMIVGHTINIALGIIGPFLHSLRLHYVEFFSKFYKGGGVKYTPFGEK